MLSELRRHRRKHLLRVARARPEGGRAAGRSGPGRRSLANEACCGDTCIALARCPESFVPNEWAFVVFKYLTEQARARLPLHIVSTLLGHLHLETTRLYRRVPRTNHPSSPRFHRTTSANPTGSLTGVSNRGRMGRVRAAFPPATGSSGYLSSSLRHPACTSSLYQMPVPPGGSNAGRPKSAKLAIDHLRRLVSLAFRYTPVSRHSSWTCGRGRYP